MRRKGAPKVDAPRAKRFGGRSRDLSPHVWHGARHATAPDDAGPRPGVAGLLIAEKPAARSARHRSARRGTPQRRAPTGGCGPTSSGELRKDQRTGSSWPARTRASAESARVVSGGRLHARRDRRSRPTGSRLGLIPGGRRRAGGGPRCVPCDVERQSESTAVLAVRNRALGRLTQLAPGDRRTLWQSAKRDVRGPIQPAGPKRSCRSSIAEPAGNRSSCASSVLRLPEARPKYCVPTVAFGVRSTWRVEWRERRIRTAGDPAG